MNWRTSTVVALCQAMREAQDYSACPILADALQDADYPIESTLAELRGPMDRIDAEGAVAFFYSEETALAKQRIYYLAQRMGKPGYPTGSDWSDGRTMNYERLMTAAHKYADTGDDGLGGGSMCWSNLGTESAEGNLWTKFTTDVEYLSIARKFWKDWCLVTGRPMPKDSDYAIFRCEC